jgi:tRNA-2-methylthio-N6-dimethylallyladenosine synthase
MMKEMSVVGRPTLSETKKFFIETFGCQMNVLDSERAGALLRARGYEWTEDLSEADVILFNTCSVREKAAEKVFARVGQLRRQKKSDAIIGVLGCVAQTEGERLFEQSPDVRLVVGTQALRHLGSLLDQLEAGAERLVSVRTPNRPEFDELLPAERRMRHIAYVTIMEGCDKFCTFCIVPFTRGRERSRSPENIFAEVRALAAFGYKEIQLLGQNVNSYGMGRRLENNHRMSFAELLRMLAMCSGIPRIKFTTSHPRDFGPDIVRALEEHANLCPWVHLPPQAGSNRVLAAMNRGYTGEDYLSKVEMIRQAKRDINLTGDMIIGFPGETDEDFRQTMRLVKEAQFDGLYIFKYSPRPGTVSAKWGDGIPDMVKTERFLELQELQRQIQLRRDQRYLDQIVEVLVEGKSSKSNEHWTGHTSCHKVVNFSSSMTHLEGLIVQVEITRINPHSLFGRHIEPLTQVKSQNNGGANGSRSQGERIDP